MNLNLKIPIRQFLIVLIFSELKIAECESFIQNASEFVIKTAGRFFNKPRPTIIPVVNVENKFSKPIVYEIDENELFTKPETEDFTIIQNKPLLRREIKKKFGENIQKYAKTYLFNNLWDVLSLMKEFLKHLAGILFYKGSQNFSGELRKSINFEEPNLISTIIKYEKYNETIFLFCTSILLLFKNYEIYVKPKQCFNQQEIVKEQIRGLFLGNDLVMLSINSNPKTMNLLNPYLNSIDETDTVDKIYNFFVKIMRIIHKEDFKNTSNEMEEKIKNELAPLKTVKKSLRKIKLKAVEILLKLRISPYHGEAPEIFEIYISHPFEVYFLYEWRKFVKKSADFAKKDQSELDNSSVTREKNDVSVQCLPKFCVNVKKSDVSKQEGRSEAIEIKIKFLTPIKDMMSSVFLTINKNIESMQNDIYQFLRKLRSAFQNFYLDEIISIIQTVPTGLEKNEPFNLIISKCKTNIHHQNMYLTSALSTQDVILSLEQNCWIITNSDEEIYIFKIFQLRGLFLEIFEYLFYNFETEIYAKTNTEYKQEYLRNISDMKETDIGIALQFLPKDYIETMKSYFNDNVRNKSELLKLIKEKEASKRNNEQLQKENIPKLKN